MNEIIPYDQARLDAGYYDHGERGGFHNYQYDHPSQQEQLAFKFHNCGWHSNYESILFVGCAYGYDVSYFRERGKQAFGVDISQYAIEFAKPEAKPFVQLYDGCSLERFKDDQFDQVAAFDVLTIVPDAMLARLVPEIIRVAKSKILVRTVIKNFRNESATWDTMDGCSTRYMRFEQWDKMFSESGKFRLEESRMRSQYESVTLWVRA